jgi:FKBP-type peptidyl-prolyl cis-trans isomerase
MSEMIRVEVDAKQIVLDWMGSNAFIPSNKKLLRQIGDTNTILLSESISQYRRWEQQGKLQEDRSFYWTQLDCEIETGYSRSTQTRAFKDMEKRGLLKTESRKVLCGREEKTVRFIKLHFNRIAELMFSNDDHIIAAIREKYEDLKKQNQNSKQKSKENKMIQNESSQSYQGMTQNESSEGRFKMNHPDDSKWVTSNKDLLIINNLEEEEEKASPSHSELIHFLLSKEVTLENAIKFEARLLEEQLSGFTYDQVLNAIEWSLQQFLDGRCDEPYIYAVGRLKRMLDGKVKEVSNKPRPRKSNPIRRELLPDWFEESSPITDEPEPKKKTKEEIDRSKQEIEDLLKKLRS